MHNTERWLANERSREQKMTDADILLGAMQQNLSDFKKLSAAGITPSVGDIIGTLSRELVEVMQERAAMSRSR